jgi:hypothetical protein
MTRFVFSDPNASIERLQRQVRAQENALHFARENLRAARAREGLPLEPLEVEQLEHLEGMTESAFLSPLHAALFDEADRRRRGLAPLALSPEASAAATARLIVAADQKRRGLAPIEPQTEVVKPTVRATPEDILAADRKRRGEK